MIGERRYTAAKQAEIRVAAAVDGKPARLGGYAALFGVRSQAMGGPQQFYETILPGAFSAALESGDEVLCTIEHMPGLLLGKRSTGTLRLFQDARGLGYEVDLPNTTYAADLVALMNRGDIDGSSFGFIAEPAGVNWRRSASGEPDREIRTVKRLLDVSVVSQPAYSGTSAELRSLAGYVEFEAEELKKDWLWQQEYRKRQLDLAARTGAR